VPDEVAVVCLELSFDERAEGRGHLSRFG